MNELLQLLVVIAIPLLTPLLFYVVLSVIGVFIERSHLARLDSREQALGPFPIYTSKSVPSGLAVTDPFLVTGSTVIGGGFLKRIVSNIRAVFGGEVASYTKVLSRGRREAQLRMIEEARSQGAQTIINVRFETSDVGGGGGNNRAAISEVFCYGTAVRFQD